MGELIDACDEHFSIVHVEDVGDDGLRTGRLRLNLPHDGGAVPFVCTFQRRYDRWAAAVEMKARR